jgi:hypothetical protein
MASLHLIDQATLEMFVAVLIDENSIDENGYNNDS